MFATHLLAVSCLAAGAAHPPFPGGPAPEAVRDAACSAGPAFYAWRPIDDALYTVQPGVPDATLVTGGPQPIDSIIAEIEHRDGVIYGSDTGDNSRLHTIDPETGLIVDTLTMTFPFGPPDSLAPWVVTSMEFVGDVLYAGLTVEGGGETWLVTIDLDTGDVATVGAAPMVSVPLAGLAWDGATMYAATAGGSTPTLYTVDLATGEATLVGEVTLDGVTGPRLTALEFCGDRFLYALPNLASGLTGHLLEIDPHTAVATDLGDLGTPELNALAAINAATAGCNAADLAEPFGTLDLDDITFFIAAFNTQDPSADLDGNGLFDLADLNAFVTAFQAGCP